MPAALTLGPLAYHWPTPVRRDFYARIAEEAPVDTVYLGEVICSKRAPFVEREMPEAIERLERAGKQVVLSSLAEVMLPRERQATRDLMEVEAPEVEINNVAGLYVRASRPHRIGPFLNAYNEATIAWMVSRGATHVCLPPELPGSAIDVAACEARKLGLGVEVQVFGRAPLAVSARCYHARSHGRTRDTCQYICEQDPDGMPLRTLDGSPFLRINGIQTLSESYINLSAELDALIGMGVGHLRLMPQDVDMLKVIGVFRDRLDGRIDAAEADDRLTLLCPDRPFSNGFFHRRPGRQRVASTTRSRIG